MSDLEPQSSPFTPEPKSAGEAGRAGRIFISYRRKDAPGHVIALLQLLHNRFGEGRIFKDTDGIEPGQDFVDALQRELATCSVMLVIIGREWLTITEPRHKTRRLDDPKDFLRMEVATALPDDHVLVVPVLVDRAEMPSVDELPDEIRPLARRNAIELTDNHWKADVGHLIGVIEKAIDPRIDEGDPQVSVASDAARTSQVPASRLLAHRLLLVVAGLALSATLALTGVWFFWSRLAPATSTQVVDMPEPIGTVLTSDSSRSQQLAQLRARASSSYKEGRLSEALEGVRDGLSLAPQDQELTNLLAAMLRKAQDDVSLSEGQARTARAPTLASTLFKQASDEKTQSETWLDSPQRDRALTLLWAATQHFNEARTRALARAASMSAPDSKATAVKAPETKGADAKALELNASDRKAIEAVLEEFRQAYNRKDTKAMLLVYPNAQADAMIRRVRSCTTVNLTFGPQRLELLSNGVVQVEMQSTYGCRANTGQGSLPAPPVADTFQLERRTGSWVIAKRLVPM